MPQFTTLNADTIPKPALLKALDEHQPKVNTDLIAGIMQEAGVQTADGRIHVLASIMLEQQMLKII